MEKAKDNEATAEDIARSAAELASTLDPTGISGAVAAYTYPKCSKYFKELKETKEAKEES